MFIIKIKKLSQLLKRGGQHRRVHKNKSVREKSNYLASENEVALAVRQQTAECVIMSLQTQKIESCLLGISEKLTYFVIECISAACLFTASATIFSDLADNLMKIFFSNAFGVNRRAIV